MNATMTTARQSAEHLARAIQHHNLADLMYVEIRENTRLQQLFERLPQERVPRMLRKIHIRAAIRAAVVELGQVREVLV